MNALSALEIGESPLQCFHAVEQHVNVVKGISNAGFDPELHIGVATFRHLERGSTKGIQFPALSPEMGSQFFEGHLGVCSHPRTLFLGCIPVQENGSRLAVPRALTGAWPAPSAQSSQPTESRGLSSGTSKRGSRSTLVPTSTSVIHSWPVTYARGKRGLSA